MQTHEVLSGIDLDWLSFDTYKADYCYI
jgi:hypothetical protein